MCDGVSPPEHSVRFCKVLSVTHPVRVGQGFQEESSGNAEGPRRQTLLWSCSVGLSEAEDWLGREASRPSADTGEDL